MARASNTVVPILVVMLMLILDFSVGASAIIPSEDGSNQITEESNQNSNTQTINEIPKLICDDEVCPEKFLGIGFPPWDATPAVEEPYWWMKFNTCLLYTSPSPRDS